MKLIFQKSTGKTYLTSPEMAVNDQQFDLLVDYTSNEMSNHFPEIECDEKEFILWVDRKPKDFQKLISKLSSGTGIPIPNASEWT